MRRNGDGKGEPVGLEATGVEFDPAKGVAVDDTLQTSNRTSCLAGCPKATMSKRLDR